MKNIIDALNINIQIFFCIIHPTNKLVGFLMSFIVNHVCILFIDEKFASDEFLEFLSTNHPLPIFIL